MTRTSPTVLADRGGSEIGDAYVAEFAAAIGVELAAKGAGVSSEPKRSGRAGQYFMALNAPPKEEPSLLTYGRLSHRLMLRNW